MTVCPSKPLRRTDASADYAQRVASHFDSLCRQAMRFTKDEDTARDLAQDTILKALGLEHLFNDLNMAGWLATMQMRMFQTEYKNGKRFIKCDVSSERLFWGTLEAGETQNQAESNLGVELLEVSLNQLRPKKAEIIRLRMSGYKYEEISEMVQLPLGTVRSFLHYGRNELSIYVNSNELPILPFTGVVDPNDAEAIRKHHEKANGTARPENVFGKALLWLTASVSRTTFGLIDKEALAAYSGVGPSYINSLLSEITHLGGMERQRMGKAYHYRAQPRLNSMSTALVESGTKARFMGNGEKVVSISNPRPNTLHSTVEPPVKAIEKEDLSGRSLLRQLEENPPWPRPMTPSRKKAYDKVIDFFSLADNKLKDAAIKNRREQLAIPEDDEATAGARAVVDQARNDMQPYERFDQTIPAIHATDFGLILDQKGYPSLKSVAGVVKKAILGETESPAKTYGFILNGAAFCVGTDKDDCVRQAGEYLQKSGNLSEVDLITRAGKIVNVPTLLGS